MKKNIYIILFLAILYSCAHVRVSKSFAGSYSKIKNQKSEGLFYSEIELIQDSFIVHSKNDSSQVGIIGFINSQSKKKLILEFPINWHERFIPSKIPYFNFRIEEKKDYWVEYFYPDSIDTVQNFFSSRFHVILDPLEKLEIKFIFDIMDEMKCKKNISLRFRYYENPKIRRGKVNVKCLKEPIEYKTKYVSAPCVD